MTTATMTAVFESVSIIQPSKRFFGHEAEEVGGEDVRGMSRSSTFWTRARLGQHIRVKGPAGRWISAVVIGFGSFAGQPGRCMYFNCGDGYGMADALVGLCQVAGA